MEIGFLAAMTAEGGDIVEIARATEAAGFDSLWIPEHPIIPAEMKTIFPFTDNGKLPEHYGRWADPFIGLAAAAAATKRLKLGTGICLIPERETLVTAKVAASLDLLSGGRFLFGIGAGWLREETEALGANFGTRWKRTRESIEAMKLLWSPGNGFVRWRDRALREPPLRATSSAESGSARDSRRSWSQGARTGRTQL